MKAPSPAPAYLGLFVPLCEIARAHGYALAPHGTMARDFDLIAVPWTEDATDARTLVDAIAKHVGTALGLMVHGDGSPLSEPSRRPHGRLAWAIPLHVQDASGSTMLDVSVMPRVPAALDHVARSEAPAVEAGRRGSLCSCWMAFEGRAEADPKTWLDLWNEGELDFTTDTNQLLARWAHAILAGDDECCALRERMT